MRNRVMIGMAALGVALGSGLAGAQDLPPAADKQVDFKADVWPIFAARCVECHCDTKKKSGLRLDNKADAMKGGTEGSFFVAGDSAKSLLIQLVTGTNENFDKMPPDGDPLSAEQIGLLRAWIDQGANWPMISPRRPRMPRPRRPPRLKRPRPRRQRPRRPAPPQG